MLIVFQATSINMRPAFWTAELVGRNEHWSHHPACLWIMQPPHKSATTEDGCQNIPPKSTMSEGRGSVCRQSRSEPASYNNRNVGVVLLLLELKQTQHCRDVPMERPPTPTAGCWPKTLLNFNYPILHKTTQFYILESCCYLSFMNN